MVKNNQNLNIDANSSSREQNADIVWEKLQARPDNYASNNFSTTTISCINGEVIRYLIKISSNSATPLYTLKITDNLIRSFSYIENSFYGRYSYYTDTTNTTSIDQLWGTPIFNPTGSITTDGKLVGGSIEWTIPTLDGIGVASNNAFYAELFFDCQIVYTFPKDTLV